MVDGLPQGFLASGLTFHYTDVNANKIEDLSKVNEAIRPGEFSDYKIYHRQHYEIYEIIVKMKFYFSVFTCLGIREVPS